MPDPFDPLVLRYLDAQTSPAEEEALAGSLRADPGLRARFVDLCALHGSLWDLRAAPALPAREGPAAPRPAGPRRLLRMSLAAAAAVALAWGIRAALRPAPPPPARERPLSLPWQACRLADGSVLRWTEGSRVEIGGDRAREPVARLDSGVLEVDAAHDPARPLRIATPLGEAAALGTRFHVQLIPGSDVRKDDPMRKSRLLVSVFAGLVAVATPGEESRVRAGQELEAVEAAPHRLEADPLPGWIRGLGSESFEARARAAGKIRAALEEADKAGDGDGLGCRLAALRRAGEAADLETRSAIEEILKRFRRGALLWERNGTLPGMPDRSILLPDMVLIQGHDPQGRGWAGAYATRDGTALWEIPAGRLPGHPFFLRRVGDAVLMAGRRPFGQSAWAGLYRLQDGRVVWEQRDGFPRGAYPILLQASEKDVLVACETQDAAGSRRWISLLDLKSGKVRWEKASEDLPEDGRLLWAQRAPEGIRVLLSRHSHEQRGKVALLDAADGSCVGDAIPVDLPREPRVLPLPSGGFAAGGFRYAKGEDGLDAWDGGRLSCFPANGLKRGWERNDLPTMVQSIVLEEGDLLASGAAVTGGIVKEAGWIGSFGLADGSPRWERNDLPFHPRLSASPAGILVWGWRSDRGAARYALEILDPRTGRTLDAWDAGMLGGDVADLHTVDAASLLVIGSAEKAGEPNVTGGRAALYRLRDAGTD